LRRESPNAQRQLGREGNQHRRTDRLQSQRRTKCTEAIWIVMPRGPVHRPLPERHSSQHGPHQSDFSCSGSSKPRPRDKQAKCSLFVADVGALQKQVFCHWLNRNHPFEKKAGARFLEKREGVFFLNAWKSRRATVVSKHGDLAKNEKARPQRKRCRLGLAISLKPSSSEQFC